MTPASRLALGALLCAALATGPARAQPTEESVKAAFLPRFARYVTWPGGAVPGAQAPFQLCVLGRDPFGGLLDRAAAGELIDGHSVSVRRIASPAQSNGCHLAFVQGNAAPDTGRMLLALRSRPILTVTDARAGPQRGMIHFAVVGGRVRFFIDDATAADRGLTISSRLLALAAGVRQRR
ncbi:MAG TPA: YfiR family protein [Allosphingosinicella sp.]|nr:YfiR family protein [Allosphingosinicella sp.]